MYPSSLFLESKIQQRKLGSDSTTRAQIEMGLGHLFQFFEASGKMSGDLAFSSDSVAYWLYNLGQVLDLSTFHIKQGSGLS